MNETNLTSQHQRTIGSRTLFERQVILPGVALMLGCSLLLCAQGCEKKGTGKPTASSETKSGGVDAQPAPKILPAETSQTEMSQTAASKGGQPSVASTNAEVSDKDPVASNNANAPGKTATPGKAELVSFDDLKLGMPVDTKFRPRMLTFNQGRVKQLFGKRIIVAGYMDPTDSMKGVTEFILLRNLECKFGPGGQADHLVRIYLPEGETTSYTNKIVYVEGELVLNPFPADPQEPITWSIYDLEKSTSLDQKTTLVSQHLAIRASDRRPKLRLL